MHHSPTKENIQKCKSILYKKKKLNYFSNKNLELNLQTLFPFYNKKNYINEDYEFINFDNTFTENIYNPSSRIFFASSSN